MCCHIKFVMSHKICDVKWTLVIINFCHINFSHVIWFLKCHEFCTVTNLCDIFRLLWCHANFWDVTWIYVLNLNFCDIFRLLWCHMNFCDVILGWFPSLWRIFQRKEIVRIPSNPLRQVRIDFLIPILIFPSKRFSSFSVEVSSYWSHCVNNK